MGERYFDPQTYRSDSNQRWRHGCPHDDLRAGAFPWLQLLVHPEIWVYEGATMGQTMRSLLAAETEPASPSSSPRTDRPLVTLRPDHRPRHRLRRARNGGAPARRSARTASATCGSSARTCPSGRSAATSVTRSTSSRPAPTPASPDAIRAIVEREAVDAVLPQSSFDLAGPGRAPRRLPGPRARLAARTRSTARTTRRRRTRCCTGSASRAGVPARQRRRGGRGGRARARLPGSPGLLQTGVLVGVARASACSTRPSTGRTSS